MKRNISIIILGIITIFVFLAKTALAITVTATPNPANVNQNVTINIISTFTVANIANASPTCAMEVNFGDGSPWVSAGTCTTPTCVRVLNHIYTNPGTYTISVRSNPSSDLCPTRPHPPDPVSASVTVRCAPINFVSSSPLPHGTAGQAYTYQLQTTGGQAPIIYDLVGGSLPPGLNLSPSGLISGAPMTAGAYSFTIMAEDNCPVGAQRNDRTFSITVSPSSYNVSLNVTPRSFQIPRGLASVQNLSYSFTATRALDINLSSSRGMFMANGAVIGEALTPVNVSIRNGTGRANETLNIPVAVTRRAEDLGASRITYVRTFAGPDVSITGQAEIIATTEAGAGFRVTRLQLYFENNRAEITVKRNQPPPKLYADIRFTGSGLLQGYWEVDGRLLLNVFQHLVYGRTVTIEAPEIPPLPTFDTGTHIVRFVITNPQGGIVLPEAIYFVTAEEFKRLLGINLIQPANNSLLAFSQLLFAWEGRKNAITYLIEFLEEGGIKPIFSAYTRKSEYKLPDPVLKTIFAPGRNYLWRVKGFDSDNNVVAESGFSKFIFGETASYVPGQIVLAIKTEVTDAYLEEIMGKHDLFQMETL